MHRYAVVGSSQGTGLRITNLLASEGVLVRAISRNPPPKRDFVEPFVADVTRPATLERAFDGMDAVFFTVDATGGFGNHMLFGSRAKIRDVTYQGCLNTIDAASRYAASPPIFVLLSVIGSDRPSMVWSMLDVVKPGSKRNVRDREAALARSFLPYVIIRAPKLSDTAGGLVATAATPPSHKLDSKMGISRADLAAAMILAARHAPKRSTWDVFSDKAGPVPAWLKAEPAPFGEQTHAVETAGSARARMHS